MTLPRARLAGALLVCVLAQFAAAGPAGATAFRYWSFWRWTGTEWAFQQQGPAVFVPADGAVDGWRFALSPDGGQQAARPGGTAQFAALCAGTPPRPGYKRVAVLLDFGTAADAPSAGAVPAPRSGCAQLRPDATSAEVVAAVAPPLRYDTGNGLLCAIAGYPAAGCGEPVAAPAAADPAAGASGAATTRGTPVLPLPAALALIAAVGAGAAVLLRRRPG
ncbi:SCO2322 family protein [Kitasatospora sp. NPDC058965]|uniref:SCO2322 family protein n=1 Tax=Kitasatospora sp. NPDC058965 TaxID=3346682 RepID=UPI00367DF531